MGQTGAELDVQPRAGLMITGTVGVVYSIEYVTDLAQTNNPRAWRCLEFYQLPTTPYHWTDQSDKPVEGKGTRSHRTINVETPTGPRFYRAVRMEAPTNMVWIPQYTKMLYTNVQATPPEVPTRVYDIEGGVKYLPPSPAISRGFWMGKYEVTQAEYAAVMGHNPSWFNGDRTKEGWQDYGSNLNRPVERVGWSDAMQYCAMVTERERLAGRIAANSVYRLPTGAEWEYACQAWTQLGFDVPVEVSTAGWPWFSPGDICDLASLAGKLRNPTRSIDRWLADRLSGMTRAALMSYQPALSQPVPLRQLLLREFDVIRGGELIYDKERFAGIELHHETMRLLSQRIEAYLLDRNRLNRLLLEDAYPRELVRNLDVQVADYGWNSANSEGQTHPVGRKLPSPWGLYDLHGNVWEWLDWKGKPQGGIVVEPAAGREVDGMFRGGSWSCGATTIGSCGAIGTTDDPEAGSDEIGFRVILVPGGP